MQASVPSPILPRLHKHWATASLASQFALMAALVIGAAMAFLGWWVSTRIERGVISHAATSASLHMDIFIEPQLQDLARTAQISPVSQQALLDLRAVTDLGQQVVDVTIWNAAGNIVFSTAPHPANAVPANDTKLALSAWQGDVQSIYESIGVTSSKTGIQARDPVLKVFAPMHETGTSRIIAVAELDESSPQLAAGLVRARMQTSGVVGLLSLAMFASLFGVVRRGSRMIEAQRRSLEDQVGKLTSLNAENLKLQIGIVDANRRVTERNDKSLRRIGAELHDGPVQLIALSLLRLESLKIPGLSGIEGRNHDDLQAIESALRDALKEVRDLCSGLTLPNLDRLPASKVIDYAIMNHERRSRTRVKRASTGDLTFVAPPLLMMCIYRFIQEALNNAVKHASGKEQRVNISFDGTRLKISVLDSGPGMTAAALDPARFVDGHGLGLAGLKDRVETLGGRFTIESRSGVGTSVSAVFELPAHNDAGRDMSCLATAATQNTGMHLQ